MIWAKCEQKGVLQARQDCRVLESNDSLQLVDE